MNVVNENEGEGRRMEGIINLFGKLITILSIYK
jgi:hypothetical protein